MKRWAAVLLCAGLAGACLAQSGAVIKTITVRGNKNINSVGILTAMRLQEGKTFLQEDATKDEETILSRGFFKDVKILTRNITDNEVEVFVDVVENPVVKEIRFEGNTVVSAERLTALATEIQPLDSVLNARNIRPIRDAIEKAYSDEGYFVQLTNLAPDPASEQTLLVVLLEPRVRNIELVGLNRTKKKVVDRIIKTTPGEVFSTRQWTRDLQELYATGWFETLEPSAPQPTTVPGEFDLRVEFTEGRTGIIGAGVELDPQSRLVGTVNYSDSNFRGNGQSVGVQFSQATVGGGASGEIAFTNRFYDSKDTVMNLQLFSRVVYNFTGSGFGGLDFDDEDRFDERRTGFSLSFRRPVSDHHRFTLGLTAQNIRTINLQNNNNNVEFIQQDGDLAMLQLGFEYNTTFPSTDAYEGQALRLLVEPGYSNITKIGGNVANNTEVLGENFFVRTSLEYRKFWALKTPPEDEVAPQIPVLAVRARYGHISGTVPFFEQLFVGGSGSLRGYENQRFWGSQSFLGTVEYRQPIQKAFSLIGFVDYGGAWGGYGTFSDFDQGSGVNLRLGYGVGVAFRTPIGPIRIDFAFNQDGGSRTHFSFGTSF